MNKTSIAQQNYLDEIKKTNSKVKFFQIGLLVFFIILWEALSFFKVIDPFIFSQPSRMLKALIDMMKTGTIFKHVGVTVFETVVGFVLGTIMGTGCAVVLWWNEFIYKVSQPYLIVFNSLPKTALAPIIIVWMGNNMSSIIVTALLTSVIVTILNVLAGFMEVDYDKIKLVYILGGNKKQVLTKVLLPASVPTIVNALKINVGLSFVGVIVGEFLVAKAGLGYLITYASQVFKLDWVMLSVVILGVLSALLYKAILIFEKFIIKKWE